MAQAELYNQRLQMEQMLSFLAGNPDMEASIRQQIGQLDALLADTAGVSSRTLSQLIDARLIRHEAQRRGLVVSSEDIDRAIQEAFGFFPGGTPTASPSPTVDATLAAQATATFTPAPSPTSTSGPSPTATTSSTPSSTPTSGPPPTATPTATPYTRPLYDEDYRTYLDDMNKNLNVPEDILRARYEEDLYRQRLLEAFASGVARDEEQVWAKHILVSEEGVAFSILSRYRRGESWDALAAAYSTDTSNKDRGGDLGWFSRGAMVDEFETAAFSAAVGEVAGPVQSPFGWHLILVRGHETRRLDEAQFQQAVDTAFGQWLTDARQEATLEYDRELYTPTPPPTATPLPATEVVTPTP
jgi:parvulin-like peptidyl-prolyl isomerase